MSRFVSANGLTRLADGSYMIRPAPVDPPAVTLRGQAVLRGEDYFQPVAVPSPPENWAWRVYRFGSRVAVPDVGDVEVFAGKLGDPVQPLIFYLVSLSSASGYPRRTVSQQHAVTPDLPAVQPWAIVGSPNIDSTGVVGSPFVVTWPTITNGAPTEIRRIDFYSSEGSLVIDSSVTDIPTTTPDQNGKWAQAYWEVTDPILGPVNRASRRVAITTAVVTPAPVAADFTILRTEYDPPGQTVTFRPVISIATKLPPWEIGWRTGPFADTDAPYGTLEQIGPNEWRLADAFFNPGVNSAIYRAGELRNTQLRFRVRPNGLLTTQWSAEGPAYTVPVPVVAAVKPPAPVAADATLLRTEWVPAGQQQTFKGVWRLNRPWTYRWRTGPLAETEAPFGNMEPTGTPNEWRQATSFFTPTVDSSVYRDNTARQSTMRFSVQTTPDGLWSDEGPTYTLPAPSIIITPPPPGEVVHGTATNATNLKSLMISAPGGTTVLVRPGIYDEVSFTAAMAKSGGRAIVRAIDPANRPVIRQMSFNGVNVGNGFVLDGLDFCGISQDSQGDWTFGRSACSITGTQNMILQNCVFRQTFLGLVAIRVRNAIIRHNEFRTIGCDGLRIFYNTTDTLIENNLFHEFDINFNRVNEVVNGVEPRHPDSIQGAGGSGSENNKGLLRVTIRNNVFKAIVNGRYHSAIYLQHEGYRVPTASYPWPVSEGGNRQVSITGNYIEHGWPHGITLVASHNSVIRGNLIRRVPPFTGSAATDPRIVLSAVCTNTEISNNRYPDVAANSTYANLTSSGLKTYASGRGIRTPVSGVTHFNNLATSSGVPDGWVMPRAGPYTQA